MKNNILTTALRAIAMIFLMVILLKTVKAPHDLELWRGVSLGIILFFVGKISE